jgi:hypothetical protein
VTFSRHSSFNLVLPKLKNRSFVAFGSCRIAPRGSDAA